MSYVVGSQARHNCYIVVALTPMLRTRLLHTRAILGRQSMPTLIGWLALDLPAGKIQLRTLLFMRPEAAAKAKRDATPLRLISWLSYKLNPELELFIEQAMVHLSTWEETEGGKVLQMGKKVVHQGDQICTETELRDRLIDLVSVGNLRHKPEALFALFRQFMMRTSLPRLVHFFDLVISPPTTHARASSMGW